LARSLLLIKWRQWNANLMPKNMHSSKRPQRFAFHLKTLSAAVVSALLFSNANAAGLGKLTVLSALGQPLHAEIELTSVSKDDDGALVPKLASPEAFAQAKVEFNPALFSLRFALEQRAGHQYIRITSSQPINEPFVDMLLQLNGPDGQLVREYTFLLDPPDLRNSQSAQVAPTVLPPAALARREPAPNTNAAPNANGPASSAAPAQKATQPAAPKQSASVSEPPQNAKSRQHVAETAPAANKEAAEEYKVKSGDSLSKIAGQVKPDGISLDQMLVALYRANPDAFAGKNMNRLRTGQILSVPDAETAAKVSTNEARNVILAQAADFNSYRNKLAGQIATAAPEKSAEPTQSATGKISTKVEEQATPASESKDKLKLSKAGALNNAGSGKASGASTEDSIAKDKAIADQNARIKELEKNVGDLQKLLEVKDKELANQQKQAESAKNPSKPDTAVAAASTPAATASAPTQAKPADNKAPETTAANTSPDKTAADNAAASAAASAPPPTPVVKPAPKPRPKVIAPPPSFFDDLTGNPLFYPAVGILAALAGGLGLYAVRRRRQKKQFEDSIITDSSLKMNSLFGSTGGQSVDTNNSIFNSSFAPSVSQLDSNEVDPVAEADVYIAYGRDAQAEEILKEALRTQPERNAVRVKLLEIYANRKDVRSFETLASELYGSTKGAGADWKEVAALGASIDPTNPLYASASGNTLTKPAEAAAPAKAAKESDLDSLMAMPEVEPVTLSNSLEEPSAFTQDVAEPAAPAAEKPPVEKPSEKKADSNALEFDLDGLGFGELEVPHTMPRPEIHEPEVELGDMNFDFLDDTTSKLETAEAPAASPVAQEIKSSSEKDGLLDDIALDDFSAALEKMQGTETPSLEMQPGELSAEEIEVPEIPEIPHIESASSASENAEQPGPLDFDLSGITLELNPADTNGGLIQETYGVHDTSNDEEFNNNTEMATKLDLALAYQEIGDKEGARELLDEVVKGGSAEQTEKAKSLLLKLA
jgi:pilus assembly protein FimV